MASTHASVSYNANMMTEHDTYYRALTARDTRFDGIFFVGVKTTGIYCRPVCTAKTPSRKNCRFFASAAGAEQAGFRPCLRCRPELAPAHAPVDSTRTTACAAAARIEAGALSNGGRLQDLAESLGVSSRQLRRSMRKELGVTPIQLAQTNRLLLAKRLITETRLPMVQVAWTAGFESVRRFNALFRSYYRLTPSKLRRSSSVTATTGCLRLMLAYRPPLDWEAMLRFLEARAIRGVECVTQDTYYRTVRLGEHRGWLSVKPIAGRNLLAVELSSPLAPVLPAILQRLRHLFDLDARPDVIASHLTLDPLLAPLVRQKPGLRVPGAFDSFELALRAIVGQQISVPRATHLASRIAQRFGEAIETPLACLTHVTPSSESIAAAPGSMLSDLGLTRARANCLRATANALARREIDFQPGDDPNVVVARLIALPGIGSWTAHYMAMRALHWPDAFPAGDLGLKKAAGLNSAKALEHVGEQWRPWRAYAAMHLWESLKKLSDSHPVDPSGSFNR